MLEREVKRGEGACRARGSYRVNEDKRWVEILFDTGPCFGRGTRQQEYDISTRVVIIYLF